MATVARADAVDDTLAKFLDDKFPQTAAAIGELSAEAPPQAAAILEALGDNRLMIDPADHIVAYKTAAGALLNAKTGETIPDANAAAFKKVRVNNALRSAIEGARGISDPSQSRSREAPLRRRGRIQELTTPTPCLRFRRNLRKKATRGSSPL